MSVEQIGTGFIYLAVVLGLLVLAAILPPPAAVLLSGVAVAAVRLRDGDRAES